MQYEQSMEKDAKKLKLLLQREAQTLIELYPNVGGYYTDKTMISLSLLEAVKFGKYSPYSYLSNKCVYQISVTYA